MPKVKIKIYGSTIRSEPTNAIAGDHHHAHKFDFP